MNTKFNDILKQHPEVDILISLVIVYWITKIGIDFSLSHQMNPLQLLNKFASEAFKFNYISIIALVLYAISMCYKDMYIASGIQQKGQFTCCNGHIAGFIKKVTEDLMSISIKSIAAILFSFYMLSHQIKLTPADEKMVYAAYSLFSGFLFTLATLFWILKKPDFGILTGPARFNVLTGVLNDKINILFGSVQNSVSFH